MLLVALVALPLVAGLALATGAGRTDRRGRSGVVLASVGTGVGAVTTVLAAVAALTRPTASAPFTAGLTFSFGVDGLSAAMVVTVAAVTTLVLLAAAGEPALRSGRFVGTVLVFAGAMLATVTATTLPALLGGWEVMGATSWLLIAHFRARAAGAAATTAFLTTRAGDVGLYVAAGAALAGGVSSLSLADLPQARGGWLAVVTVGVVVAALAKSAQLPFSSWLSGAMIGPSPVSALLHSATMVVAGAYLLVRLGPLLAASGWAAPLVAWVGAATAVVLGVVSTVARDLKQLLAASTASQVGTMVLGAGLGAGSAAGATAAGGTTLGLLVAHAAVKSLLFLAAGAWLTTMGSRALEELAGAARRHRVVGICFTVGALALAGAPPLSLWWTKEAVLSTLPGDAAGGAGGPVVVGQVGAVLSAVAAGRALWFVWRPDPRAGRRVRRATRSTGVALVVLAVPAAGLGGLLVATGLVPVADPGSLLAFGVLVLAALAATWALHNRPVRRREGFGAGAASAARQWWGLDAATRLVVARPVLALAGACARAEHGLDRGVRSAAGLVPAGAALLATHGEAALHRAVAALAGGIRALGTLARRPQTGRLHQYYAQTVSVLGVLAALVVVLVVSTVGPGAR